jgi:hypothetical protein
MPWLRELESGRFLLKFFFLLGFEFWSSSKYKPGLPLEGPGKGRPARVEWRMLQTGDPQAAGTLRCQDGVQSLEQGGGGEGGGSGIFPGKNFCRGVTFALHS